MSKTTFRLAGAGMALAASAAFVRARTADAERAHPPRGHFITVDGVRLHYTDDGQGPPVVVFHGLGSMVEELALSGLLREAAKRHRVIAFDRPGYGHSERPRRWRFSAATQARLFYKAIRALDVHRPVVLAHSWGALVAIELVLQFPGLVRSMVLESGLYFPRPRADLPLLVSPAIPVLGDLMSHTVSPLIARAMWPAWLKMLFAPAPVPSYFARFPMWMALRPSQLRATAEDAAFTLPAEMHVAARLRDLRLPITLVVGRGDRYVDPDRHTMRMHRMLPRGTRLVVSPHSGHMVHHSDLPLVLAAIAVAAMPLSA